MVTLQRTRNYKIAVYGNEHGVPHFHVEGAGFRCSVAIATLEVLVGNAPGRALTEALAWAAEHQSKLLAEWQMLNGR